MNDVPEDSTTPLSTEENFTRKLLKESEEERARLEKAADLLNLKAEELAAKRSQLDETENRITELETC